MEWSFKCQEQALPPWREHRSILTKWQPRNTAQQLSVSGGASPVASPRAGCCCCCQGAGAVQVVAAARAAEHAAPTAAPHADEPLCVPSGVLRTAAATQQGNDGVHQASKTAVVAAAPAAPVSSAPSTPTQQQSDDAGCAPQLCRTSLLSRSLEAAGLDARIRLVLTQSLQAPAAAQPSEGPVCGGDWWEQPRVHVVRRSA